MGTLGVDHRYSTYLTQRDNEESDIAEFMTSSMNLYGFVADQFLGDLKFSQRY